MVQIRTISMFFNNLRIKTVVYILCYYYSKLYDVSKSSTDYDVPKAAQSDPVF